LRRSLRSIWHQANARAGQHGRLSFDPYRWTLLSRCCKQVLYHCTPG
jgi:hypothetical protein